MQCSGSGTHSCSLAVVRNSLWLPSFDIQPSTEGIILLSSPFYTSGASEPCFGWAIENLLRCSLVIVMDTYESMEVLLGRCRNDLSSGNFERTEQTCREFLEKNPDHRGFQLLLGLSLKGRGKSQDAKEHFEQIIENTPDFAEAYFNLGILLFEEGRFEEALFSCHQATEVAPGYAEAHALIASILHSQKRHAEAIYHAILALEVDQSSKLFIPELGLSLVESIGFKRFQQMLLSISNLTNFSYLPVTYASMGILKYQNFYVSGEQFIIEKVLPELITCKSPVLFDVGAFDGSFSIELRNSYPEADIYAFEPNPRTYEKALSNHIDTSVHCYCLGVGSAQGKGKIYDYADNPASQHASAFPEVFSDLHHAGETIAVDFEIVSMDEFCAERNVEKIDFLKIDTEGYELEVLKGAQKLIANRRIQIIQFEFNEMNVISRVFLRDFYQILVDYQIYRIDTERLISLPIYNSENEIFKFQNFLAVLK
jgi:FkbM family methyltransferase